MKRNYIALAVLAILIGYRFVNKSPQARAEQAVSNWMKHSYESDYETLEISFVDTLSYSRKIIEDIEFCKKEMENRDSIFRYCSQAGCDMNKAVEIEKQQRELSEGTDKYNSLRNSKQFFGYSVLHTYKAKGQEHKVYFLLDKEITHVTDTIHCNDTSTKYLSAVSKNKLS